VSVSVSVIAVVNAGLQLLFSDDVYHDVYHKVW